MEIKHRNSESRGAFYVELNGEEVALMTYSNAGPEKIIIDHTEVSETLKGQGIGKKLVEASVQYARKHGKKILPLCPFANAVFKKTPEYDDVRF
ncbi:GNAT family N-acetyltransferase [Winogradskyella maritima]|uniref:GNAT family N-acetyltransferase n=1 Tax=Winogradskyella maritima TaxID=1517766 RepID=A0ABV8AKY4_9FLAO|nr:GNAT family N-acetyltransferase [Winogradskyella maritima]